LIRWPFEILYQNGEWSPDVQNDFQLENVRLLVLLFWCVLLLGLVMYSIYEKKLIGFAIISVAFFVVLFSYQPSSLYRMNNSWTGVNADYWYYEVENSDLTYYDEPVDYRVSDYDIKASLNNELHVTGTMNVVSDIKKDEFIFTLYHGYEIKDLYSVDRGVKTSFVQNKDTISIKTDRLVNNLKLYVDYKGHHNKYYSNNRGALLPGYLPWYPMPGKKQIYLKYNEYGKMYGYNPYNRITPAHIVLHTNKKIFTNLERKGDGIYEGTSDSITLLGGNITKCDDEIIQNVMPLALSKGFGVKKFVSEEKNSYYEAVKKCKDYYGIDVSKIENKKVLFASKDLGRNNTNNNMAVFDDYILASPGYISCNEIIHNIILGDYKNRNIREKSSLIKLFMMTDFDNDSDTITEDLLEEMKYRKENKADYSDSIENIDEWIDILSKVDSKTFVKKMVEYAVNPALYRDDEAFFQEINKIYDRD
jgi:hypothetical protein